MLGKALSRGTKGNIIQTVSQVKPGVQAVSSEIYLRMLVLNLLNCRLLFANDRNLTQTSLSLNMDLLIKTVDSWNPCSSWIMGLLELMNKNISWASEIIWSQRLKYHQLLCLISASLSLTPFSQQCIFF